MSADLLAFALAILSAVTVALANVAVKRGGDVLTARMILSIAMALTVSPGLFFVPAPPKALWPALLGSVAVHWLYQFSLIRSLHRGDLSLVFPVMRGMAPLFTAALAFLFLHESLSPPAIGGLILASAAILVFAQPPNGSQARRHPDRAALFWAALASIGIAAYAVVDASVARAMPETATFVVYLFLLDWIGITLVAAWTRRDAFWTRVRPQLKAGLLGGFVGAISYGVIIYAYALTDSIALITAARETSVVFAAIFGWALLKEGFGARRTAAAAALACGLMLMQFGG